MAGDVPNCEMKVPLTAIPLPFTFLNRSYKNEFLR